jgi:hypothetical protein
MFRSYIDKYPDGHFKALAVTHFAKLTRPVYGRNSGRPGDLPAAGEAVQVMRGAVCLPDLLRSAAVATGIRSSM